MSRQQRESRGRTVDEAVSEALLFMGLRREEVRVTVLQKARSGVLGLGRRDAVVLVEKKPPRGKDLPRGKQERDAKRPASGPGQRSGVRARRDDDAEKLGEGPDGRQEKSRGGRGRRLAQRPGQSEGGQVRARDHEAGAGADPSRQRRAAEEAPAGTIAPGGADRAPDAAGDQDRRPQQEGEGRRRRRPRRRRRKPDITEPVGEGRPELREAHEPDQGAQQPEAPAADPPHASDAGPAPAGILRVDDEIPRRDGPGSPRQRQDAATASEDAASIAHDTRAGERCRPWQAADAEPLADFLQRATTDLMIKSGFPCRVQVQEGDYHQVKMVVDDRSAGILIGRYGNTVDAVEYLVEKIASKARGERVRMNLDINNYRLRCEDQLVQRARAAAAEARETGEPVAMPPAAGRDRRIVHLYIQEMGDLVTYTEDGPDGKYVTICRPDQVPEHAREGRMPSRDERAAEDAGPGMSVEIGVVMDVDAGSSRRADPDEGRD